jgi:hypothetical protein
MWRIDVNDRHKMAVPDILESFTAWPRQWPGGEDEVSGRVNFTKVDQKLHA